MGCSGCSSGRGCSTSIPNGCRGNGNCGTSGCNKLDVFDWLVGIETNAYLKCDIVEVRFKNSRKEYFKNSDKIPLQKGDVVATEAMAGHDIGIVSLTGELVRSQLKKRKIDINSKDIKKIYRKARQNDIDKWIEGQQLEDEARIIARNTANKLNLQMKIGDVEYQGDKTKAIFYYIADDRVDFRELIKVLADKLKIRIEMKQIGARQEAGRIGGIGSCGRELCCSTWLTDFRTVSTSAARYQQLSINPLKLAGQCGKLKCCLNYELDVYLDALKDFPKSNVKLHTQKSVAIHQKTDVFKRKIWYSYDNQPDKFIELSAASALKIAELNKKGIKPESLELYSVTPQKKAEEKNMETGEMDMQKFEKALLTQKKHSKKNKNKRWHRKRKNKN